MKIRRCPRCEGSGFIRGAIDPLAALFTLGLTALVDLKPRTCPVCDGDGFIGDSISDDHDL
jgi:ribosomal protein S27AE